MTISYNAGSISNPNYGTISLPGSGTTYAVQMTAAASGSTGIAVADSDDYDFSTTDFTVFWEGDFFDFDAAVHLMSKLSGGEYVELIVLNSQIMRLAVNGDAGSPDAVQSTATVPSAKGFYAATYEAGSPNATVRFYYNGQKLGADVATASHGNLSNAGAQVISGRTVPGIRELSNTIRAGILNFKLSDAQVAQLYSSGIPDEWMWGSNVELTSGTLSVGKNYRINTFVAGDDFTNVGAASNADGIEFTATGTTPTTWSNGSALVTLGATLALLPETLPISPALEWPDSANGNNGTLPATGATKVVIRR